MEQEIDLRADIDYWIKDVKFPQLRGRLIMELFDLQDVSYQEHEWFKDDTKNSFGHEFQFVFELFEDLDLFDIKEEENVLEDIGVCYKSKKEIACIIEVAKLIWSLSREFECFLRNATNQQYRNSKCLSPLRKAAAKAFTVFMENEKDNIEFVKFLERLKTSRLRKIRQDL